MTDEEEIREVAYDGLQRDEGVERKKKTKTKKGSEMGSRSKRVVQNEDGEEERTPYEDLERYSWS